MATTLLSSASLCATPDFVHKLQPKSALSFSNSSLLSPLVLQSRAFSSDNGSTSSSSYSIMSRPVKRGSSKLTRRLVESRKADETTPPTAETNALVKLAWYTSEAFGKAVSGFRPKSPQSPVVEEQQFEGPVERKDVVELIRADLDRSYFVTGNMATGIYEADCEFADPFVSFKGLQRFKQNVGNLGSFMEESSLKLLDWQEYEDRIYAKWRFNCVLALPWRPILAASGSTEYFFSTDSGKIYKHIETWDISPVDGLRQLFKPNPKRKAEKTPSV